MADKVHCIRKTLRLMPQEAKVLSDKAKANGMNEAEYIRLLISQKPNYSFYLFLRLAYWWQVHFHGRYDY